MKPNELLYLFTEIVSQESHCTAAWSQHPGPLTTGELLRIGDRIGQAMEDLVSKAAVQEVAAK